jgi:hypothetical protein
MILFAAVALLVSVRVIVTTALAGMGRTMLVGRMTMWGALATIGASIALVPAIGMLGVPLGQLAGAAVVLPALVAGLGPNAVSSVRRAAAAAGLPTSLAIAVGIAGRFQPLSAGARGILTAVAMAVAFTAATWTMGPRWIRDLRWPR